MFVLEVILWLLIAGMIYAMVGYPILMILLSKLFGNVFLRERITPPVSLIISAYNEEEAIAAKLENSLALDYPRDRLEIIVASDGSTDSTDAIVGRFADRGVKLLRFEGGMGKTAVLNAAVPHASGEILIFSDATGRPGELGDVDGDVPGARGRRQRRLRAELHRDERGDRAPHHHAALLVVRGSTQYQTRTSLV